MTVLVYMYGVFELYIYYVHWDSFHHKVNVFCVASMKFSRKLAAVRFILVFRGR